MPSRLRYYKLVGCVKIKRKAISKEKPRFSRQCRSRLVGLVKLSSINSKTSRFRFSILFKLYKAYSLLVR